MFAIFGNIVCRFNPFDARFLAKSLYQCRVIFSEMSMCRIFQGWSGQHFLYEIVKEFQELSGYEWQFDWNLSSRPRRTILSIQVVRIQWQIEWGKWKTYSFSGKSTKSPVLNGSDSVILQNSDDPHGEPTLHQKNLFQCFLTTCIFIQNTQVEYVWGFSSWLFLLCKV